MQVEVKMRFGVVIWLAENDVVIINMPEIFQLPAENSNSHIQNAGPLIAVKVKELFSHQSVLLIQNLFCYKLIKKEIPVDIANWYLSLSYIYRIVIYRIYFIDIYDVRFADSDKETFRK